jgi:hypothetical protein
MNFRVPQMAGRFCASERLPIVKGNTLQNTVGMHSVCCRKDSKPLVRMYKSK